MSTPVRAVLDRLDGVRETGDGWEARCPAHDDREPSLSVSEGDDGRVLVHCHAGCRVEDVAAALGLSVVDLFPDGGRPEKSEVETVYSYVDEKGEVLYELVRFEGKSFAQRRPDGAGGWEWRLGDVRRVLYRLPDVLRAAEAGNAVMVVEGEKDADRLADLGFTATTCPGGAGAWRDAFSGHLKGAVAAIVPDNDREGREHAEKVARSLHRAGVEDIRIVELPGLSEGGDVSDWLDAGGDADALKTLMQDIEPWDPEPGVSGLSFLDPPTPWTPIPRAVFDVHHRLHPMQTGAPACRSFALCDLRDMAEWREDAELLPGSCRASVRFLAERWKWTKSRVNRFLRKLEEAGEIVREQPSRDAPSIIRFIDFDRLRPNRQNTGERDTFEDTPPGHPSGTPQRDTLRPGVRGRSGSARDTPPGHPSGTGVRDTLEDEVENVHRATLEEKNVSRAGTREESGENGEEERAEKIAAGDNGDGGDTADPDPDGEPDDLPAFGEVEPGVWS